MPDQRLSFVTLFTCGLTKLGCEQEHPEILARIFEQDNQGRAFLPAALSLCVLMHLTLLLWPVLECHLLAFKNCSQPLLSIIRCFSQVK